MLRLLSPTLAPSCFLRTFVFLPEHIPKTPKALLDPAYGSLCPPLASCQKSQHNLPMPFPRLNPPPVQYFQVGSHQRTLHVTYWCLLLSYCSTRILEKVGFYLAAVFLTPRGAKRVKHSK